MVHPLLLPHAAAAPSSSQWDPPCLYHLTQDPHHTQLALGLLRVPRVVLGVCFPVQSTPNSTGAVAAPTTGVLRTLVWGARLRKRWKVQTLLQSHPSCFWEQFLACTLAKNMPAESNIQHGCLSAAQPCPGCSAPALLPKPVQAASRLVATENKVIPCSTCQYLHCKWMKLVYLINDTTVPLQ